MVERARGSLSRSTLLLRESILEADEEGAGEGRREGGGGYGEEGEGSGEDGGQEESHSRGRAEVAATVRQH